MEEKLKLFFKNKVFIIGLFSLLICFISFCLNPVITGSLLSTTIRHSTPLVLGALCGLLGERAGVMNIGIEGQMLFSAFIGFLINVLTGNLLLSVLAAILAGSFAGFLLAVMSIKLKIDQIIAGIVLNILAFGITGYFYNRELIAIDKIKPLSIPFFSKIPVVGEILFNHPPITIITIFLVFIFQFLLFKTGWGLRTRAVGEHPKAADTMGINVFWVQYSRIIIGGAIAGLAGAFLSLEAVGAFERGMTNGRGFIAIAVMIFGKWTPFGSWIAALIFGFFSALQIQLQFSGNNIIPIQFTNMLPYLITIIIMAIFIRKNSPPKSLGVPYEKE